MTRLNNNAFAFVFVALVVFVSWLMRYAQNHDYPLVLQSVVGSAALFGLALLLRARLDRGGKIAPKEER